MRKEKYFFIFRSDGSQDVKLLAECNSSWESMKKIYEKQSFIIQIKLAQREKLCKIGRSAKLFQRKIHTFLFPKRLKK